MIWRCDVTNNPVGTDTIMIGAPACDCQGCRASAEIERLRAALKSIAYMPGTFDLADMVKHQTAIAVAALNQQDTAGK